MGRAIRLQVERPPDQSYLNRLWNTQVSEQENESRSRSLIDGVSQYFTLVVLLLATGTALFWQSTAPALTWTSFSAVLIVACPCALALTVPFTLGNTLRILGRHRFYGKNTDALEKLGKVTDIVFDKTGTLTVSGGRSVRYEGETLSEKDKERIWNLARQSAHPLSRHIASHLFRSTFKKYNPTDYEEEPGQGISAEIDGERIFLGTARKVGKSKDPEEPNALVHVRTGDRIRGTFTFSQELRTGTKELLEELGERYRLHLLTGDQGSLPEELKGYFDADKVRTGMVPHQKKQYIEALETEGKRVLMVGDGVNDAAALRTASTGLAVSADVHTFSPASDGILEGNVLKKLGKFLSASRRSLTVIRVGFAIALTYNVAGLSYAVTANLTPMIAAILMPLSSITVVLFATLASRKIACRDITA